MLNTIIHGDCLEVLKQIPDNRIDLTVTSPPYDNLRNYNGYEFDFEGIAQELYRVTKDGGVVVWVVGDATVKGSETGTSFKQALYFKDIGFNLHDTMIFEKRNPVPSPEKNRYQQAFEYMFILSKGKPIANLITVSKSEKTIKRQGYQVNTKQRNMDGEFDRYTNYKGGVRGNDTKKRNIWSYLVGFNTLDDRIAFEHPATFPEQLANDHIITWSNEGDIVLDPMCGSGTTCKMAMVNNRQYIGVDISEEYCEIARKRIAEHQQQLTLI
jgi:DNA modification methylase